MIYLLRHGQTDWNVEKRLMGLTDIPLNESGKLQAQLFGKEVSQLKINHIFSSNLLRAKETAEIINKFINVDISLDKRLQELNYGVIEGRILKEISSEYWDQFNIHPEQLGAESFESVYNRIKSFFRDLIKKNLSNALIVTHGGALRMMRYYEGNRDYFNKEDYIKNYLSFKIEHASIIEWKN